MTPLRRKLAVLFSLTITISLGALIVAQMQKRETKQRPLENQLKWHAKEAKLVGKNRVEIPACQMFLAEASSIGDVARSNDVLLVQVIDEHALTWEGNWIDTWHKAVILETLSAAITRSDEGHVGGTTPQSLLPLNRGEIVFKTNGGRIVVDGVEIIEGGPTLLPGQQYILFAALHADCIATVHMGANSIFRVEAGEVKPISKSPQRHVIKDYISSKGNSLEAVKAGLKGGPKS